MAMSAKQLSKLELLYKRGEHLEDIARRLHISKRTITNHANKNGWTWGESKREFLDQLAVKEGAKLMESSLDAADNLREGYMRKVNQLENMVNAVLRALGSTPEEIRQVSRAEADRVFAILKNLKISSEITNMHYEGSRRALGLDLKNEDDAPDLLPIKINVTNKKAKNDDESSSESS